MTINSVCRKIDPEHAAGSLRQETAALAAATEGELVLDFSAVPRIDADAIRALDELAGLADAGSVRIILRGVNMDIYKVLKLMSLTTRFGFQS